VTQCAPPRPRASANETVDGSRAIVIWKNVSIVRGLAIVLVVANHGALRVRGFRVDWLHADWNSLDRTAATLAFTIPHAATAAFLIASGYFLGRFATTWRVARVIARSIALRWALWSACGFASLFALERGYTSNRVWESLGVFYGPFQAYWFLVVILITAVASPLLARWAAAGPLSMTLAVAGLETLRAASFYTGINSTMHVIPFEMSFALVGFMLAAHTKAVVEWWCRRQRLLAALTLALLVAALVETYAWWNVAGGPSLPLQRRSGPYCAQRQLAS
jgi:hypothetical protein